MFWSRVDDAKSIANDDIKFLNNSKHSSINSPTDKSDLKLLESSNRNHEIIKDLSNYLFDLFDANCMEEFKKIEKFEHEALSVFINSDVSSDYSIEQELKHKEFLSLLEELLSSFLVKNNLSIDELFVIIESYINNKDDQNAGYQYANEIVDTIAFFYSFETWAEMMKDNCKQMNSFSGFTDKLLDNYNESSTSQPK